MHTVDGLIARGGWGLDDVQARGRANPDTFWLPPEEDLARIVVGSAVRLIFAVVDQADTVRDGRSPYGPTGAPELTVHYERMWLWVERLEGDDIVGVLQNVPVATHTRLVPNARVRFRRSDVIDIQHVPPVSMWSEIEALAKIGFPHLDESAVLRPEDPLRDPSISPTQAEVCRRFGTRPERPWAFARCLVGRQVTIDSPVLYGVHARSHRDPKQQDCGWAIWSADPDMGVAAKKEGFDIVDVGSLYDRHPRVWAYLALPTGWAFVLGAAGHEDVYQDTPPD